MFRIETENCFIKFTGLHSDKFGYGNETFFDSIYIINAVWKRWSGGLSARNYSSRYQYD